MYKPCKYCKKYKRCKKLSQIKRFVKQFRITSLKINCSDFTDRMPTGQRVLITQLYTGKYDDISINPVTGSEYEFKNEGFITSGLLGTVQNRCKTKPTKLWIKLDTPLEPDRVQEDWNNLETVVVNETDLKRT